MRLVVRSRGCCVDGREGAEAGGGNVFRFIEKIDRLGVSSGSHQAGTQDTGERVGE